MDNNDDDKSSPDSLRARSCCVANEEEDLGVTLVQILRGEGARWR